MGDENGSVMPLGLQLVTSEGMKTDGEVGMGSGFRNSQKVEMQLRMGWEVGRARHKQVSRADRVRDGNEVGVGTG